MVKSITTIILAVSLSPVFAQWELKNLDEKANYETIHKIEFFNASTGYAMGTNGLVLKTTDSGETWESLSTTITNDIADFDYTENGEIIATTLSEGGTLKSSDGIIWDQVFTSELEFSNIYCSDEGDFYLSGAEKLYHSGNQGQDWEEIYDLKLNGFKWGYIRDVFFLEEQIGYAVGHGLDEIDNSKNYCFLLKTIDKGITWNMISEFDHIRSTKVVFVDEMSGYVIVGDEIFYTIDGGSSWEKFSAMYGVVDYANPDKDKLISVNRPEAYTGEAKSTVFLIDESNDGGATWTNPEFRNGAHLETIHFINDSVGFVAGDYSIILKTTTCGGELGEDYPWHIFTSSTKEINHNSISIYPNPTSKELFLELPSGPKYQYKIIGINGLVVRQGTLEGNNIDVSKLNPGLHVINITRKDFSSSIQFVRTKD